MDNLLALTIPGSSRPIDAPEGIPTGAGYSIGAIASFGISVMMIFGIILALMFIVYGGFFWIQSKGDKEQLDKSRRIILNSILGLVLMSLSLVIVNLVATAVGVDTSAIFSGEN